MKDGRFFENNKNSVLIAILCAILWGSAFPVLKITYLEMNMLPSDYDAKVFLAGLRFFIASLMLFAFVKFGQRESIRIEKKNIGWIIILGLLQTTLGYFFFYNGLANTTAMKGAILGTLENFLVVIGAHFIYKNDRINLQKVVGLITGLLGVIIVNMGNSFSMGFRFTGEGFMIISAICSALATFLAKNKGKTMNVFLMTAWQMFLGSIIMLFFGIPVIKADKFHLNEISFILLIYSAILSAVAFSLWYVLLTYHKAGSISLYKFVIPISGAIFSVMFIPGEIVTSNLIISLILVSLGIVFINLKGKKQK